MGSSNMQAERQRDITAVSYSFVVPVHNEAEALPEFYSRLQKVADSLGEPYEIIFVDDGSTDDSLEVIDQFHQGDDRVKYISLFRSFGPQGAITAGYDYATGSAIISLHADGRHPPEVIPQMVARWREGYEVVNTVKVDTGNVPLIRRFLTRWGYRVIRWMTGMDVDDEADFRLLDRKVVVLCRQMAGRSRFLYGLVRWAGFHQASVEYEAEPSLEGKAGYNLKKPATVSSTGLFNFSLVPLRLIGLVGAIMLITAVAYAIIALILWPFRGGALMANLVMLAIGLTGMQLVAISMCAEYIGRVYTEARNRPLYVVRRATGFEPIEEEPPAKATTTTAVRPSNQPTGIRLFT